MRIDAVLARFIDLDRNEVTVWIEQGWVRPEQVPPDDWFFEAIDLARLRLIYDLRRQCDLGIDVIPLVLSLVDQVYELRSTLHAMSEAIETQPAQVREAITQALKTVRYGP